MSADAFMPSPYLYLYLYLQHNPLSLSTELYLMVHPDTLQRHTGGLLINLFRLIYSLCCSQRFERNKSSALPLPSVDFSSQCHSAGPLAGYQWDSLLTWAVLSRLNALSGSHFWHPWFWCETYCRVGEGHGWVIVMGRVMVMLGQTLQLYCYDS